MTNIKKISIIFVFAITCLSMPAFAQGPTELPNPSGVQGTSADKPFVTCGKGDNEKDACGAKDINPLIQAGIKLVFVFGAFIAAGMFAYAGFLLITAAGNASQIQKAKDVFTRVVIGFLIMFLSYLLVKNLLTSIEAKEFFKNIFN